MQVSPLTLSPSEELDTLYRTPRVPRLWTRAQMVLLSAERGVNAPQMAVLVRESEATTWRCFKRNRTEGLGGLQDTPHPGRPAEVIAVCRAELLAAVRRLPRSLG